MGSTDLFAPRHSMASPKRSSSPISLSSSPLIVPSELTGGSLKNLTCPLMTEMPWFTSLIWRYGERRDILPADLMAMSGALLWELQVVQLNDTYREIVFNRATLMPNQKSAEPLPALLFALRLLDVAALVNGSLDASGQQRSLPDTLSPPCTVAKTILEGQTGKLRGVRSLGDRQGWPHILLNMHSAVGSCPSSAQSTLRPAELQASTARQLVVTAVRQLDALRQRETSLLVFKAVQNLESASFFINYMLRMLRFPPSVEDFGGSVAEAWYHYGSDRPPVLLHVESLLWSKLFAMARGVLTAIDALKLFLKEAVPLIPQAFEEVAFFDPDSGKPANMPVSLSYVSNKIPREFIEKALLSGSHGSSASGLHKELTDDESDPTALDINSLLVSELWDVDNEDWCTPILTTHDPVGRVVDRKLGCGLHRATGYSKRLRTDRIGRRAILSREGEIDGGSPEDKTLSLQRKEVSTVSARMTRKRAFFSSLDASPTGDAWVPLTQPVHRPIDDSIYGKLRLSKDTWRTRVKGDLYLLATPLGKASVYWPSSYSSVHLDSLDRLLKCSNAFQRRNGDGERFIRLTSAPDKHEDLGVRVSAATSPSPVFHVFECDEETYLELERYGRIGGMLASQLILVHEPAVTAKLCRSCAEFPLSKVGSLGASRLAIDVSSMGLDETNERAVVSAISATLNEFLQQIQLGDKGKIMYFPRIPDIATSRSSSWLSVDTCALRYMSEIVHWQRTMFPLTGLNWFLVASADVSHFEDMCSGGFNTILAVESGALLVFIAVDSNDPCISSRLGSFLDTSRCLESALPDTVGLLLKAGDRM
ncbi:hypothetical protein VNI00_011530 [Paramarasmius palmivorus]|uniref:Uncharacterized protein n=1 Tax=Paramarasmius palmivorus TaxID=297713 RepID=A0AAW0CA90_9AGAR